MPLVGLLVRPQMTQKQPCLWVLVAHMCLRSHAFSSQIARFVWTPSVMLSLNTWNPLDSSVGSVVEAESENHGEVGNAAYLLLGSHCSQFSSVPCCRQGWSGQDDLPDYVYEGVLPPLPTCAPGVPPAQQASHLYGWPLSACRWLGGKSWDGMKVLSMLWYCLHHWTVLTLGFVCWVLGPSSSLTERTCLCPKPPLPFL